MPADQSPDDLAPFSTKEVRARSGYVETNTEDEARTISPFKQINRNEDTLDADDNVIFSDFRPIVLPADAPDPLPEVAPKAVSAPGLAPSSGSTQTSGQQTSTNPVQPPADEAGGQGNPTES